MQQKCLWTIVWSILLRLEGYNTKPATRDHALHSSVLCFYLAPLNFPVKLSPSGFLPSPWDTTASSPSCCKIQRARSLATVDWMVGVGTASLEAHITCLPNAHQPPPPPPNLAWRKWIEEKGERSLAGEISYITGQDPGIEAPAITSY